MLSKTVSTAISALVLVMPVRLTTSLMMSSLITFASSRGSFQLVKCLMLREISEIVNGNRLKAFPDGNDELHSIDLYPLDAPPDSYQQCSVPRMSKHWCVHYLTVNTYSPFFDFSFRLSSGCSKAGLLKKFVHS